MISIVIPVYNEENIILETCARIEEILQSQGIGDAEIIVVDDGSTDNTHRKLKGENIKYIRHPHNIGYGRSLKDGIIAARNDTIVIIDADRTYPVEILPELIEEFKKGFNMVVGARSGKHFRGSLMKNIFRKFLKILVQFTAGRKIPDINSGFRIFSKKEVLPYMNTLCDTFSFTTSLTLAYMMNGMFVGYLPVVYRKRVGKSKVRHFRDSLRTLQYIIEAIMYYNPIKIFILIILPFLLGAVVCLAFGIYLQSVFLITISIHLVLFCVIIFCIGLLAILLKKLSQSS